MDTKRGAHCCRSTYAVEDSRSVVVVVVVPETAGRDADVLQLLLTDERLRHDLVPWEVALGVDAHAHGLGDGRAPAAAVALVVFLAVQFAREALGDDLTDFLPAEAAGSHMRERKGQGRTSAVYATARPQSAP